MTYISKLATLLIVPFCLNHKLSLFIYLYLNLIGHKNESIHELEPP